MTYSDEIIEDSLPLDPLNSDIENNPDRCPICELAYSKTRKVTRHHLHNIPQGEKQKIIITCSVCNIKIKRKSRIILWCYDLNFAALDIINEAARVDAKLSIVKSTDGNTFRRIDVDRCRLQDAQALFSVSLHKLIRSQPESAFRPFEYLFKDSHEKIKLLSNGMAFPHFETFSLEQLSRGSMSDYNTVTDIHDMRNALGLNSTCFNMYEKLDCKSMLDYAKYYLLSNTFGLVSSLLFFNDYCMLNFKVTCLNDVSLAQFSFFLAHYLSKPIISKHCKRRHI